MYMINYQDDITLCAASAYTQKYYINEDFSNLPEEVQNELKIMCVLFTEDIGGTIRLYFTEEGELMIEADKAEEDLLYDDIGAPLKVKQLQREKRDLLEQLETYYKTFFLE